MLSDRDIVELGEAGFIVRDGLLGDGARALAARACEWLGVGRFRPRGIGAKGTLDAAVRSDETLWLERDDFSPAFEAFEALRGELNARAFLGLREFELQLSHYPPGASYQRHRDALRASDKRRVTCIVYLNEGWSAADGGALRLHLPSGPLDLLPSLDQWVMFLAEKIEHEVLPTRRSRFALTAWYRVETR